jgi:hypothetical protein
MKSLKRGEEENKTQKNCWPNNCIVFTTHTLCSFVCSFFRFYFYVIFLFLILPKIILATK